MDSSSTELLSRSPVFRALSSGSPNAAGCCWFGWFGKCIFELLKLKGYYQYGTSQTKIKHEHTWTYFSLFFSTSFKPHWNQHNLESTVSQHLPQKLAVRRERNPTSGPVLPSSAEERKRRLKVKTWSSTTRPCVKQDSNFDFGKLRHDGHLSLKVVLDDLAEYWSNTQRPNLERICK